MRTTVRCAVALLGVLVPSAIIGVASAQNARPTWKQYSFPEDGFAISLPDAPRKHPDRAIPDATAYSVNINPDYAFTVRAKKDPSGECRAALVQIREGVLSGRAQGSDPSSLKEVQLDGHAGIEFEWKVSEDKVVRERYYCGEGRMYVLAVNREINQPLLPEAVKILQSFTLLPPSSKK